MSNRREITGHQVEGQAVTTRVYVLDAPGPAGAHHAYAIEYTAREGPEACFIKFQNGPLAEAGANGITNEALLAVVIDRLEGFQRGPFACEENNLALRYARDALWALNTRTRSRMVRGVEGTTQP